MNKIIANVDDDPGAEIVVSQNFDGKNCGAGSNVFDPLHRGLACVSDADCPYSSNVCHNFLCRCALSGGASIEDECDFADTNAKCHVALPGDEYQGLGTCRTFRDGEEDWPTVRVFEDARQLWGKVKLNALRAAPCELLLFIILFYYCLFNVGACNVESALLLGDEYPRRLLGAGSG